MKHVIGVFPVFGLLLLTTTAAAGMQRELVVTDSVHFSDIQNREPMVVQLEDGTLLVSGFPRVPHVPERPPSLWQSADGGRSWTRMNVGTPAQGAVGQSDVDLALGPDGTVYFITMGFNRSESVGTHVSVGVSRDRGGTWTWTNLTRDRFVDRPWIDVAPDGTVHVIWNDGAGVARVVSRDRGRSWTPQPRVHGQGGSSHLAVGPGGELAVRITPTSASGNTFHEGVDLIAVSTNGGAMWRKHPAPGTRTWSPSSIAGAVPRWVEPIAWDTDGRLYHLWSEGREMWLGRSADAGATWSRWVIARHDAVAYFPYLTTGPDGELAGTWFSGANELQVHLAVFTPSTADAMPSVALADPIRPSSWQETDGDLRGDTAGEYVPVTFLEDGALGVVTPLQDPRTDRLGFSWWRFERR